MRFFGKKRVANLHADVGLFDYLSAKSTTYEATTERPPFAHEILDRKVLRSLPNAAG